VRGVARAGRAGPNGAVVATRPAATAPAAVVAPVVRPACTIVNGVRFAASCEDPSRPMKRADGRHYCDEHSRAPLRMPEANLQGEPTAALDRQGLVDFPLAR